MEKEERMKGRMFMGSIADNMTRIIPVSTSILALIWIFLGIKSYGLWDEYKGPKSGFFPTIIAFVLLIVSVIAIFTSKNKARPFFESGNWLIAIALMKMVLMSYIFGLELSVVAFMLLWLKVKEKYSWKITLITTVSVMLIVVGVFRMWLNIQFPLGLIGYFIT